MEKLKGLIRAILIIAILLIISLIIAWILWLIKKYWAIAMLIIVPIFLVLIVYGAYKNDKDREE